MVSLEAVRQRDGSILAPKRAETGDTVGIGWVILRPGDPEFGEWDRWLKDAGGGSFSRRLAGEVGERRGLA